MDTAQILHELELFSLGGEGIGGWITPATDQRILDRLARIEAEPLSKEQFNQLLILGRESPVSDDFFTYYWLEDPLEHPYPVGRLPGYTKRWVTQNSVIVSLAHLKWGLYRLFVDSLLYFSNVRIAYRQLRALTRPELVSFFSPHRFDTSKIRQRGSALPLNPIPKDERYLISEMACKSYGDDRTAHGDLRSLLTDAYRSHQTKGGGRTTVRNLLKIAPPTYGDRQK
jgi:hypothetical protein